MIRVRLTTRPFEVVEIYESQLLDLQRWGLILEHVDEADSFDADETHDESEAVLILNDTGSDEKVWTYEELQEYFKSSPD